MEHCKKHWFRVGFDGSTVECADCGFNPLEHIKSLEAVIEQKNRVIQNLRKNDTVQFSSDYIFF